MTEGAHPPLALESLVVGHVEQGEGRAAGAAVEALDLPLLQAAATDARQESAGGREVERLEHGDGRRVAQRVGEAALRTEARHDADEAQRVPAQPRHHLQQLRGRAVDVVEHEEDWLIDRPEHRAREPRRVVHRGDRLPARDTLGLVERGTGDDGRDLVGPVEHLVRRVGAAEEDLPQRGQGAAQDTVEAGLLLDIDVDGAESEGRAGVVLEVGEQVRLARPRVAGKEVQATSPLRHPSRVAPELGVLVLPSDRRRRAVRWVGDVRRDPRRGHALAR